MCKEQNESSGKKSSLRTKNLLSFFRVLMSSFPNERPRLNKQRRASTDVGGSYINIRSRIGEWARKRKAPKKEPKWTQNRIRPETNKCECTKIEPMCIEELSCPAQLKSRVTRGSFVQGDQMFVLLVLFKVAIDVSKAELETTRGSLRFWRIDCSSRFFFFNPFLGVSIP